MPTTSRSRQPSSSRRPAPLGQLGAISPYRQGQSTIDGRRRVIKLSSNEGCFGPSPAAQAAYHGLADRLHRYPDGGQQRLRAAIAEVHGLDESRMVCGNGSEELIGLVMRCFVGSGDQVLLSENHFVMCSIYAKAQGADIVLAPEVQFHTKVEALLEGITDRTKVVAVANPNNPTGTYNTATEIERLIAGIPSDIVVILDGAYAEYVTRKDYDPGARWVENHDNVVMTRTFSKLYGLAGLRIGWAYGPPAIVEILNRVRAPFNTNSAALAAAEAAVRDVAHFERVVEHNARWQDRMQRELTAIGVSVVPSVTNFYLMHFEGLDGKSAAAAGEFLRANGIIPRPASEDRCLRLTVGNDEENEAVLRTLKDYVSA